MLAASGDKAPRVGSGMSGPHCTQFVVLAPGRGQPPSTEPPPDGQRPTTDGGTPERVRNGGARRGGSETHPCPGPARRPAKGPGPRTPQSRTRFAPAAPRPPRPAARASPLPPPAPPHRPRAQPWRGARGPSTEGPRKGHRGVPGPKPSFTCAGPGPGGGEDQERRQQLHPAQEWRRRRAGDRALKRPPGVRRPADPGFIAEPRREGAPTAGRG